MTEVKVRLSMSVPGAQMLTQGECDKNPKESYNTEKVEVKYRTKKGKLQKETIEFHTRKNRLAKQLICISKEAYEYMTDPNLPPTDKLAKKIFVTRNVGNIKGKKTTVETTIWAHHFNSVRRLEWHLAKIAESMGAVKFQFEILED